MTIAGLRVLLLVARPLQAWKVALIAAMGDLFAAALAVPATRDFFEIHLPVELLVHAILIGAAAAALVGIVSRVGDRRDEGTTLEPPPSTGDDESTSRGPVAARRS